MAWVKINISRVPTEVILYYNWQNCSISPLVRPILGWAWHALHNLIYFYGPNYNFFLDYIVVFRSCLEMATEEKPLIVFFDSLDQLSNEDFGKNLKWLSLKQDLPDHCNIVVSTLPGKAFFQVSIHYAWWGFLTLIMLIVQGIGASSKSHKLWYPVQWVLKWLSLNRTYPITVMLWSLLCLVRFPTQLFFPR